LSLQNKIKKEDREEEKMGKMKKRRRTNIRARRSKGW
jgi:hypothetical protein